MRRYTADEALVLDVLAHFGRLTVHELARRSWLTLGRTLLALRELLVLGDVVAVEGARYACHEGRHE